jgi:ABC-type Fe3+ transport system permease subunit
MAAIRSARRPRGRSIPVGRILLLGFFLVFVLLPLYWMFNTSIKPSDDYLAIPPVWFPAAPTLVHYEAALFAYRGLDGLINSLIISLAATVLSALFGTLMAYSLARYNTGGQHLSFWVLSQRFLPPIGIVLPVFLIYRGIGLYDTHVGLIVAYTVFTLPVSVWMRRLWSTDARAGRRSGRSRCRSLRPELSLPPYSPSSRAGPNSSLRWFSPAVPPSRCRQCFAPSSVSRARSTARPPPLPSFPSCRRSRSACLPRNISCAG